MPAGVTRRFELFDAGIQDWEAKFRQQLVE
jgi:hypothetical protein